MLASSGWAQDAKPEAYSPELVKKAEAGDALAQVRLGYFYYEGEGVTEDKKEAVKWYTMSAEQGNQSAQLQLGLCYAKGEGVTQDYKEAQKWFAKTIEHGSADAKKTSKN